MTRARRLTLLKIGLPLFALLVFSSLFFFSNARYADGISFDGVDLSALDEGLKLANPRFTGATNRGEPFTITADSALPDAPRPSRVELEIVRGEITLEDGRVVTLAADAGVLKPKEKHLALTEGVTFTTSDGYAVNAARAEIDAAAETLNAAGGVEASGPLGTITADQMHAGFAEGGDKDAYIWFEKRVKVRVEAPGFGSGAGEGDNQP